MVISNSIVAGLRRCSIVWSNFFSRYRTINLGIGGDLVENVLYGAFTICYYQSLSDQSLYTAV